MASRGDYDSRRRRRCAGVLRRAGALAVSLHTLDALDAARAIREKVLSPVDLVEALLERIDRIDGRVQAWALLDGEGARLAARQAADEAARGVFRGPLHGVPFGAKDIFYSAGLRTEAGSKGTAGHDPEDPSSSRAPVPDYLTALTRRRAPRVGVLRDFFERATPEVADVTAQAVNRLARAGAAVEEAKLPPTFRAVYAAAYLITRSDTASIHAERYALKAELYRPAIRSAIEMGMLIPGDLYVRALRIRRQFRREMSPLLERYDVLLSPTTPAPAPEGMATGDPRFQVPWSLSGLPSITVPCGLTTTGLPLGIQLVSGAFTEAPLLSAAAWCEDVLGRGSAPSL